MRTVEPKEGDSWVCVSAQGRGVPVKIVRVTPNNVQFRPVGRGVDRSRTHSLHRAAFIHRFAILHEAEDRQQELRAMERRGDFQVIDASITEESTTPDHPDAPSPIRTLTREEVREIWTLMAEGTPAEDAAIAYAIPESWVDGIWNGEMYAEWTQGILATKPEWRNETMKTAPPQHQSPAPPRQDEHTALLAELTDALELLVTFAGRPLPRYVSITGLAALVTDARSIQGRAES